MGQRHNSLDPSHCDVAQIAFKRRSRAINHSPSPPWKLWHMEWHLHAARSGCVLGCSVAGLAKGQKICCHWHACQDFWSVCTCSMVCKTVGSIGFAATSMHSSAAVLRFARGRHFAGACSTLLVCVCAAFAGVCCTLLVCMCAAFAGVCCTLLDRDWRLCGHLFLF